MPLRRKTTLGRTLLHNHGERSGDLSAKLCNSAAIQSLQVAAGGRNQNVIGEIREEVPRNLGAARVRVVERSSEHSRLTSRVELKMGLSLGEQHALVVGECDVDLGDWPIDRRGLVGNVARSAVVQFEDETTNQFALNHSQKLVGARVRVWDVEPTGVDEANSHADVSADQGREVVQGRKRNSAASTASNGVVDERERDVRCVRGVGQQNCLAVSKSRSLNQFALERRELRRSGSVAVEAAIIILLTRGEGRGNCGSNQEGYTSQSINIDHFFWCKTVWRCCGLSVIV